MRRWVFVHGLLVLCAVALGLAPAADAQTGSLTFVPPTVMAGGGKLFINGTCDPNSSGILISDAFAGQPDAMDFAGVPALAVTTGPDGTFGIGLTISPYVKGGSYNVSLRCGGGLAASGTLTVLGFGAGDYVPVPPERLLDTRSGVGAPAGIVAADGVVELTVTGVGAANVPAYAGAVVMNVTATEAQAPGFVTVWPCGQPRPDTSSLNTTPGLDTPNSVTAKIGAGGKVCLYTLTPTHLIADINGWLA